MWNEPRKNGSNVEDQFIVLNNAATNVWNRNSLVVSFNSKWEQTFELKLAVGLPGQFAGTFAGLYLYGVVPLFVIQPFFSCL